MGTATVFKASQPTDCTYCGKVALYHVGEVGYCRLHRGEAFTATRAAKVDGYVPSLRAIGARKRGKAYRQGSWQNK
jgi:hypothetical protein